MTEEEKKAYRREYYQKYQKKGLKKGRKKGSSVSIVGISTISLNDAGKMEVALIKEDLKKKMNAELAGAKTDEEKNQIRRKYQQQALEAVQRIKQNSQYLKPKASRASKSSSGSKSSKSSKSSGNSKSSESSKSSKSSSKSTESIPFKSISSQVSLPQMIGTQRMSTQGNINTLTNLADNLSKKIATMDEDQKAATKEILTDIINELKKKLGTDDTAEIQELQDQIEEESDEGLRT